MNKRELADRLARQSHKSRAKAADDVDSLVYGLLKDMKDLANKPAVPEAAAAPKPPSLPDESTKSPGKEKK